jgi:superfamily II DNA or RNA helicase
MFPTGALSTDAKLSASLRSYQAKLIQKLRAHVIMGKKRILVVGPCGMGKMVIATSIIKTSTVPVLFVAHRQELINQCADELSKLGITNIGVIRADDERTNPSASVQIASIQTLSRRNKPPAGIVIIDECHRAASDSYANLLSFYPEATVFGFTASPSRLDGRPLGGDLFEAIEIAATYGELLKNPLWLVAPDVFSSAVMPDLSNVRTVGGDWSEDELGAAMAPLVGDAVEHWLRLAHRHPVFTAAGERVPKELRNGERRRTIVFACNIAHSMQICAAFEKAGVRVAHLDGKTPEDERRAIIADLGAGKLEVVSNCMVLTEGTDIPSVKCIVHLRPTQSLVMWIQTAGRCMRPWQNTTPLLLDHAGNMDRHGAPFEDRVWSLKEKARRIAASFPMKLCKACFAYVPVHKLVCPFCGFEFPPAERKSPEVQAGELEERSTEPMELKRKYFEAMAVMARGKGFKPGFAAAKYKERYGTWPPWSWSEELREAFVQDEFWQEAMAKRLKQKEEREAREAEETRRMNEAEAAMPDWVTEETGNVEEGEEEAAPFSDWLEEEGIE